MSYILFLGQRSGDPIADTLIILLYMGIAFIGGCLVMLALMLHREKKKHYQMLNAEGAKSVSELHSDAVKIIARAIINYKIEKGIEVEKNDEHRSHQLDQDLASDKYSDKRCGYIYNEFAKNEQFSELTRDSFCCTDTRWRIRLELIPKSGKEITKSQEDEYWGDWDSLFSSIWYQFGNGSYDMDYRNSSDDEGDG